MCIYVIYYWYIFYNYKIIPDNKIIYIFIYSGIRTYACAISYISIYAFACICIRCMHLHTFVNKILILAKRIALCYSLGMTKKKSYDLNELLEQREKIALDLVDVYWEMKPTKCATKDQLADFSKLARIAGERGKIGMKAIEQLDAMIESLKNQKPETNTGDLTNEEIKMLMEFRKKNGKQGSTSSGSKA